MGRTLNKSRKRKNSKPFDPQRDYVNAAIKDYLEKGGKITKIIEDTEEIDQFGRIPEETLPIEGIMGLG